jgi:hypothetical protein
MSVASTLQPKIIFWVLACSRQPSKARAMAVGSASGRDGLGCGAGRACTGDGSLVGVDRHSWERTPHIRRVELGVALTGERRIVVHPLLADPESAGRAGGGDAREARRCRAPAALRFGATFSARDHERSPAKSIDAKSTIALQVCSCSPARSPLSATDRPHQPPVPPAGESQSRQHMPLA